MPKLQEAKKGGFFLFLNPSIVRAMNWKKGDELQAKFFKKKMLLIKKVKE